MLIDIFIKCGNPYVCIHTYFHMHGFSSQGDHTGNWKGVVVAKRFIYVVTFTSLTRNTFTRWGRTSVHFAFEPSQRSLSPWEMYCSGIMNSELGICGEFHNSITWFTCPHDDDTVNSRRSYWRVTSQSASSVKQVRLNFERRIYFH